MEKIFKYIFLAIFLASCSSLHHDRVIEVDRKEYIKTDKRLDKYSNEDILANSDLSNRVFNRNDRKINKDLKGVWVSTVLNLDFPKNKGYNPEMQKREIDQIVKNVKSWGFNAIFFQVKPASDVFYNSSKLPWSSYLTGVEGKNPGYDPLEYFIQKSHENGIELHAWINPYRVSMSNDLSKLAPNNFARLHPEYVYEYGGKLYLNPAKKEVVKYLYEVIEEIVLNYDVDGIHLDDYFYPYPDYGKLPNFDKSSFNQSGFMDLGDFRRENVNDLIKNLSVSIHKLKPNISFGISPFGIWRNSKNDINGSNTNGLQSYDSLYADSIKWMSNSWVDYIAPQIYWGIGHSAADYYELVNWWSDMARKTNTVLYVGEGLYKYRQNNWDKSEIRRHKELRDRNSNINGFIVFRYETLLNDPWMADEIK